jgi:hypothetical protein
MSWQGRRFDTQWSNAGGYVLSCILGLSFQVLGSRSCNPRIPPSGGSVGVV